MSLITPFNSTLEELKFQQDIFSGQEDTSFNSTLEELKFAKLLLKEALNVPFNSTLEELKFGGEKHYSKDISF